MEQSPAAAVRGQSYFYISADVVQSFELHRLPPKAFRAYWNGVSWLSRQKKHDCVLPHRLAHRIASTTHVRRHLLEHVWEKVEGGYKVLGLNTWFRFKPIQSINPERAAFNRLRPKLAPIVFERDGFACVWCGATEPLHVDHIKPLSRGGSNELTNLQTLCGPCNLAKGAR